MQLEYCHCCRLPLEEWETEPLCEGCGMTAETRETAMLRIYKQWHLDYPKTELDRRINQSLDELLDERIPIGAIEKIATLLDQVSRLGAGAEA